jgi:hypothetical protein
MDNLDLLILKYDDYNTFRVYCVGEPNEPKITFHKIKPDKQKYDN